MWISAILTLALQPAEFDQDAADLERAVADNRYEDALVIVDRLRDDPPDPGLEFLRATFLNRLGRHGEALVALERLGDGDANYHLELGVAHYWLGSHEKAIAELRAAIDGGATRVGEARTLLGAALAATGRIQEAQEEFEKAGRELEPDSPMYSSAQAWRDHLAAALRGPDRGWGARLSFGYGHSSNALRIGSDSQIPGSLSGRGSDFFTSKANLWVDLFDDGDSRLRLSSAPETRTYFSAKSFSFVTVPVTLMFTHDVDETFTVGAGATWESRWRMNPGRKLHESIEPLVSLEARWTGFTQTRLTVSRPMTRYQLDGVARSMDPDADAVRARVEQIFYLDDERQFALVPSVGSTWNEADGSDWDYQAVDASLAFVGRPVDELTIAAGVYAAWYDYARDHSLLAGKERSDTTVVPFVQATVRVTDWFGVTATVSHTDNHSNVALFDYTNTEWSVMPYVDLGELIGN